MSRFFRIFGGTVIVLCAFTLYGSLEQSGSGVAARPSALLDALHHLLADSGLHRRDDVLIEMNGREIALGFSRPGCDGMILVAALPTTAQSWAHLAPRLDLSSYQIGYLYKGALYPEVPRLKRLAGELRKDLRPHKPGMFPQVVAIAETGHCDLAPGVAPALEAVSWGRLSSGNRPGSLRNSGDTSI